MGVGPQLGKWQTPLLTPPRAHSGDRCMREVEVRGVLSLAEARLHINLLELRAIRLY